MLDIIMKILFVAIPSIVLLIAILLGIKRNIYQSIAKLIMTILSIVASAVIVKIATPKFAANVIGTMEFSGEDFFEFFQSFSMAGDVVKFISAFIIPAIFVVLFFIINLIFDLLYLIPGRLLSNKAFAKRALKARKIVPQDISEGSEKTENAQVQDSATEKKRSIWPKIGLRAGAIICNVLAAAFVLSMFALPINAYSSVVSSVLLEDDFAIELGDDVDEIIMLVDGVNAHPTNQCYSVFNGPVMAYFDQFIAQDGSKIVVSETLLAVVSIIDFASNSSFAELNSGVLLEFADKISESVFIKNIATGLISDLCNSWLRGETLFGIPAPEFEGNLLNVLLTKLSDCNDITVAIRAAANALTLQQAMIPSNSSGVGDTISMIEQIFTDIDSDTADLIKTFVSDEVLTEVVAMPPSMAQNVSGFVDNVLDGIIAIKDDPGLSDEEELNLLKQEASAMASIIDMAKEPEIIAPEKLVKSIVESTVISDTIQGITNNGSTSDPYEIADAFTPEFTDAISQQLDIQGVEQNSDLYKSIMALIKK